MLQTAAWLILALIHVLPAFAALRPSMLTTLYGVRAGDLPFLLVHHRAMLFLAVLAVCVWAAFGSEVRRLAAVVTAISMIGFLLLYWRGGSPEALRTIAIVDLAGLPILAFAAYGAFTATPR